MGDAAAVARPLAALKPLARRVGLRRATAASIRLRWERSTLAVFSSPSARSSGRVLCYHSIGTPAWGVNDLSPGRFRRQLEAALAAGYRFVPADRIARGEGLAQELAVTFDDGLSSVATNAAPILAELHIPWTLFVVSDWADGRHSFGQDVMLGWRDIDRLQSSGVAIGSHSVSHADFGRLSADRSLRELSDSRDTLERNLGVAPTSFAIPLGGPRNWTAAAARAARETGYELIYAQAEDRRPAGTSGRTFITRDDGDRVFRAALSGAFDRWHEWL
ncbi:MAG TPA: polysaccharide deacetylase family protein [Candidatus Limnocylindria bacterium]